jgi:very-short-patch-repair endonuclease
VRFHVLRSAQSRNIGRRGSPTATRLLAAAADRAASQAERELITILRTAKITGWRQHCRAEGHELDFAFPDRRIAIEVDGWAWHQDATTFHTDRQRQNDLVLAGWAVLRFTWPDLTERPIKVAAEIKTALVRDGDNAASPNGKR